MFNEIYERIIFKDKLSDTALRKEYLSDEEFIGKKRCRFCNKSSEETKIDKSSHAISEMVGNNRLFSYNECKECNKKFGSLCEDSFGKFILPYKMVSEIHGKKSTMCYSDSLGEIRMNKTKPILQGFNDNVKNLISVSSQETILTMTEYGFDLKLKRQKYTPEWIYFTLVKMALSILPYNFVSRYAYTLATLRVAIDCKDERQNIFDSYITPGFIEFIPNSTSFEDTSVELFLRKENAPEEYALCHFCLNFGHYSMQIPLQEDYQRDKSIKISFLPHFKESEISQNTFKIFDEDFFCPFIAEKKDFSKEEILALAKHLGLNNKTNTTLNSN